MYLLRVRARTRVLVISQFPLGEYSSTVLCCARVLEFCTVDCFLFACFRHDVCNHSESLHTRVPLEFTCRAVVPTAMYVCSSRASAESDWVAANQGELCGACVGIESISANVSQCKFSESASACNNASSQFVLLHLCLRPTNTGWKDHYVWA